MMQKTLYVYTCTMYHLKLCKLKHSWPMGWIFLSFMGILQIVCILEYQFDAHVNCQWCINLYKCVLAFIRSCLACVEEFLKRDCADAGVRSILQNVLCLRKQSWNQVTGEQDAKNKVKFLNLSIPRYSLKVNLLVTCKYEVRLS